MFHFTCRFNCDWRRHGNPLRYSRFLSRPRENARSVCYRHVQDVLWSDGYRLLPLSRSEVVAVLANCSVVRVSFSVCKKGIHADFFSIPVLNHLVGCLSQLGLFTVDSARRELWYVNKNRTVEIVAIDSLHHRFCDALPVSTLSFSRVGIVTVSEDRHDVYADTTLLFSTVTVFHLLHV